MRNNHLNQFTDKGNRYCFLFETCIHFTINSPTKHIMVTEGSRDYDFLDHFRIQEWRRKFNEL